MKIRTIILLTLVTTIKAEPAGMFDIKGGWWDASSSDVGISGNYLTTQFKDSIFTPTIRAIITTLDQMNKEMITSFNNDELFLAATTIMMVLIVVMGVILYKRRQNPEDQN